MFPLFFFVLLLLTSAYLVQFKKTYFDPSDIDILYMGDAVSSTGFVDMNRVENCCVGWVVYAKKVPLWDPNIGKLPDFTTCFSFTIGIVGSGTSDFGDGLAFFLAPTRFIIPPSDRAILGPGEAVAPPRFTKKIFSIYIIYYF